MLGESIFVGILAFFLVTTGTFLLRIHALVDTIREEFMDITLGDPPPSSVREIETNSDARRPVRWFYVEAERLHLWFTNGFVFCAIIAILALVPFTVKPSECFPEIGLLVFQIVTIVLSAVWMIICIIRYDRMTRRRRRYLPLLAP